MVASILKQGLIQLGVTFDEVQQQQLEAYLELLQKWNKVYNLTAVTDPKKMVAYHLMDSIAILQAIPQQAVCVDVGTGAGLPGIPLAIMLPQSKWVLLDSNGKKTRFVQQAIAACRLQNVKVVNSRVQDYHAQSSLDVIVSRAYASISDFVNSVDHLCTSKDGCLTQLITMKTELQDDELQSIKKLPYKVDVTSLTVPGITEKRSLVVIKRKIR